ncbi:MAG: hydrogenase small subunit [Brockia lithotrophica]|nr:hydrogenase small subunit [Brockia lithotrophica]
MPTATGHKTIYEEALEAGLTRRDFLKLASAITLALGLDLKEMPKVVRAMETKERVPVIWLEFQSCSGCGESFIRSMQPRMEKVLFDLISLEYTELIMAGAGSAAEEHRRKIMAEYPGKYVLVVEGSVSAPEYLFIGGHSAYDILRETAEKAMAVISFGSCSSWGGIPAAKPNPTGAKAVADLVKGKPVIRVPGCPPIAEVMTNTIAHIVVFGQLPELDELGRPKEFFRHRLHDKCQRRAYFDAGLFAETFDDEGARQGYCLYKLGCRGPTTYNACAELRWNGGLSWPVQSGHPCIGCSEPYFWDQGPFYERLAMIPGTQTTVNPEKVGAILTGVVVAGIAAHATATVVLRGRIAKHEKAETAAKEE